MDNKKYISVEDAIKTTWMILDGLGYAFDENPQLEKTVPAVFDTAPTADVRPVVRGEWKNTGGDVWKCSACGYGIMPWNAGVNFCPNCGAVMEES